MSSCFTCSTSFWASSFSSVWRSWWH